MPKEVFWAYFSPSLSLPDKYFSSRRIFEKPRLQSHPSICWQKRAACIQRASHSIALSLQNILIFLTWMLRNAGIFDVPIRFRLPLLKVRREERREGRGERQRERECVYHPGALPRELQKRREGRGVKRRWNIEAVKGWVESTSIREMCCLGPS